MVGYLKRNVITTSLQIVDHHRYSHLYLSQISHGRYACFRITDALV